MSLALCQQVAFHAIQMADYTQNFSVCLSVCLLACLSVCLSVSPHQMLHFPTESIQRREPLHQSNLQWLSSNTQPVANTEKQAQNGPLYRLQGEVQQANNEWISRACCLAGSYPIRRPSAGPSGKFISQCQVHGRNLRNTVQDGGFVWPSDSYLRASSRSGRR